MQFFEIHHFAGHLNETFEADVDTGEGNAPFVLVEVQPLPAASSFRQAFSLLFHNTAAILFAQRTYTMRHPQLGEFGIFLVPIARDRNGFVYQAVFN
ncbi:DUF6916 family protein [Luteibacter sp. 9135]|uniref:DUF6916 family protein n=1 Tax=Luteibacter sp. 9135 TaxID=1500893 RepID=UPI000568E8AF|nr:hypothetical protein [Luteibacter sp. 9135]